MLQRIVLFCLNNPGERQTCLTGNANRLFSNYTFIFIKIPLYFWQSSFSITQKTRIGGLLENTRDFCNLYSQKKKHIQIQDFTSWEWFLPVRFFFSRKKLVTWQKVEVSSHSSFSSKETSILAVNSCQYDQLRDRLFQSGLLVLSFFVFFELYLKILSQ